ncbi:MAG: hypothetical protein IJR66_01400 [Clostridia bacterium]|nr:hypothetical protein [Clostridia bacterium]
MTEEEKKEREEAKRLRHAKKAEKALRHRILKNFFLVVTGFILSIVMIVSTVFVGVGVIPLKTWLSLSGVKSVNVDIDGTGSRDHEIDEVISEEVLSKSALAILTNIGNYKIEDAKIVGGLLKSILESTSVISLDNSQDLNQLGLFEFDKLINYICLNSSALGDTIKDIGIFEYTPVDAGDSFLALKKEYEKYESYDYQNFEYHEYIEKPYNAYIEVEDPTGDFDETLYFYYDEGEATYKNAYDNGIKVADSEGKQLYVKNTESKSLYYYYDNVDNVYKNAFDSQGNYITGVEGTQLYVKNPRKKSVYFYYDDTDGLYKNAFNEDGTIVDGVDPLNTYLRTVDKPTENMHLYYWINSGNYEKAFDGENYVTGVDETTQLYKIVELWTKPEFNQAKYYFKNIDGHYVPAFEGDGQYVAGIDEQTDLYEKIEYNTKLYYYLDEQDGQYKKAYNDNGEMLNGLEEQQLYYADLSKVNIGTLQEIIGDRFKVLKVKKIFETFGAENDTINSILGDTTVNGLASFDANSIKLSAIMDVPTEENGYKNKTMYDILLQSTDSGERETYTYEDITIGDLQYFDINKLQLKVVLERDKNENLYTILDDATEVYRLNHLVEGEGGTLVPMPTNEISIGELNTAIVFGNIKLSSVLKAEEIDDNKILKKLIEEDVKLKDVGATINDMPITDMFDIEVWTKDSSKTVDEYARYVKVVEDIVDDPLTPDVDETATVVHYVLTDIEVTEDNEVYYISHDASVWLFLLYTSGETVLKTDADATDLLGLARYYTEKESITYQDMIDSIKSASSAVMTSTVRQIVDAGILSNGANFHRIYDISIQQAIETVANATT